MVATVARGSGNRADARSHPIARYSSRKTGIIALFVLFLLVTVDAVVQPVAPFDVTVLNAIQRVELGVTQPIFEIADHLTSTEGAVSSWFVLLIATIIARKWLASLAVMALPIGGVVNEFVGEYVVGRTRPADTGDFLRTVEDIEAASYPSGHVMGAVMLYGLIFFFARRLTNRPLALGIQAFSVAMMLVVGFGRVWFGAHWPTDVLGAYLLGGLILAGIIYAYERIEVAVGDIPFLHAVQFESVPGQKQVRALTSTVYFNDDSVAKVYAPGFLPRAIYWLAFQAPFPYIANRNALQAAIERRNLARQLTDYWYGNPAVAQATGIQEINGRIGLVSERIEGSEPVDRDGARTFLRDLRSRFEAAGLPTWQIDPRQPRAIDNVLETPDGRYMIVDLESGLVSPLASLRTWFRAIRRGMVPIYDDVYFDVTRDYLGQHRDEMARTMGEAWVADLERRIDVAEAATAAWHGEEPRYWSKTLRLAYAAPGWPRRMVSYASSSQQKATDWLNSAVDNWVEEARLDQEAERALRSQIESPEVQSVLPHFGAHMAITIVLRFPLGSIARVAWSGYMLSAATARLIARRSDRQSWKKSWDIHHPFVILLAAIPGFGAAAYLAARPVRSNRLLLRVTVDALMLKVPKGLYERSNLRRFIALPSTDATRRSKIAPSLACEFSWSADAVNQSKVAMYVSPDMIEDEDTLDLVA